MGAEKSETAAESKKYVLEKPLGAISGCPCLVCPVISKCSELGSVSPLTCSKLREWVLGRASYS